MIHVCPRTDELREMTWSEVDWSGRMIRIGPERMKDTQARRKAIGDFLIPLTPYVYETLERLHALTGKSEFLFPGRNQGEPISADMVAGNQANGLSQQGDYSRLPVDLFHNRQ